MKIPIDPYVKSLIGVPSWHVKKGHGSFITFEFGSPTQEISPVCETRPTTNFPASKCREIIIRGDWHLWIYCCDWQVSQEGNFIANSESTDDVIDTACRVLDGQAILAIEVDTNSCQTSFVFNLGGLLQTQPYDDELQVQWHLFCPDQRVLSFRSDAKYSFEDENCAQEEESWKGFDT